MGPELFDDAGFEKLDAARWRALAEKALKGADFHETLVSETLDGIRYGPISERRADAEPILRADPARPWRIVQRIDDPDFDRAAKQLAADMEGGATGISIAVEGSPAAYGFGIPAADIGRHLQSLTTPTTIAFDAPVDQMTPLIEALDACESEIVLQADLGLSPLDALPADLIERAFDLDMPCSIFRADGRRAHNAGASKAQELAFALAAAGAGMRAAENIGIAPEDALAAIEFTLATDGSQFPTIAKMRAMRLLHARLQSALGVANPFPARLTAETSFRMLSTRDAETNILRNTIAVFAAGIGGADAITVLPHSYAHGLPDRFARRIARNTQTILVDESHLGHVCDPSAGAGAVEDLTDALAEKAWAEFQAIEREGGLMESLASGALTARIEAVRAARNERLKSGVEAIVGTTIYPAAKEREVAVLMPARALKNAVLAPRSLHGDFDTPDPGKGEAA